MNLMNQFRNSITEQQNESFKLKFQQFILFFQILFMF